MQRVHDRALAPLSYLRFLSSRTFLHGLQAFLYC
jgi:hypothetical protein